MVSGLGFRSAPPESLWICFCEFFSPNFITVCDQLLSKLLGLKVVACLGRVHLDSRHGHGRLGVSLLQKVFCRD